jgi:hypothetical protein
MAGEIVVFAICSSARTVERAITALISANIDAANISVWFPQSLTFDAFLSDGGNGSRPSPTAPSYFKGMCVPTCEFDLYEYCSHKGEILLAIRCSTSEESARARRIMKGSRGDDISSISKHCAVSTEASR